MVAFLPLPSCGTNRDHNFQIKIPKTGRQVAAFSKARLCGFVFPPGSTGTGFLANTGNTVCWAFKTVIIFVYTNTAIMRRRAWQIECLGAFHSINVTISGALLMRLFGKGFCRISPFAEAHHFSINKSACCLEECYQLHEQSEKRTCCWTKEGTKRPVSHLTAPRVVGVYQWPPNKSPAGALHPFPIMRGSQ